MSLGEGQQTVDPIDESTHLTNLGFILIEIMSSNVYFILIYDENT